MSSTTNHDRISKVWELAKAVRVAMLTTRHADSIAARPMYSIIPNDEGAVWFVTERGSAKVDEARQNPDALLTYSSGSDGDHVVMTGNIAVISDRLKLKSLWNAGADIFFPKGPTDEAAVLLRFEPATAEYWTGGSGLLAFALNFVEAKATGVRPNAGEHATVTL